ncbi:MAG: serine-type D-Ala-D-Ala carboxypeptidase [Gammaproteobacteria bacterium RIFCSPHIGHO2_12_FULL_42_13]|nr:MAG: serine-type D-Ala-D-Ala carboxypeptidase [Gammaproteobacteria bacterium RIFCSPHIGHO2_12_FULL_42_13]
MLKRILILLTIIFSFFTLPHAFSAPTPTVDPTPTIVPTPPSIDAKGYVLMDADTGTILAQNNESGRMQPASLTKLMTMYVASEALKRGQIKLTDTVPVSEAAWRTGGSRMFIKVGTEVTVQDLLDGIIIASGNDSCVALAEYIGGNEQTFTNFMNQTAKQLGMLNTHFTDSTGLPNPDHYTTPYDMALLARAVINDFPQFYPLYKQKWISYNNIKQPNRNRLLWRDPTVDGLKTGHTEEAGFCLVSSALRNGMRLIAVVMGAPSDQARASDSQALLNFGYRFFETHKLYDANQALTHPRVWLGKSNTVPVGLAAPLSVTIPRNTYAQLKPQLKLPSSLKAPIQQGQVLGTLEVTLNNKVVSSTPIIALTTDNKANIFSRMIDHVRMWL